MPACMMTTHLRAVAHPFIQAARRMSTGAGMPIRKVTVVGAGTLGSQVAFQTAISGFDVAVLDTQAESLTRCRAAHEAFAQQYLAREGPKQARAWQGLASNSTAKEVAKVALDRLVYTTDAAEAMDGSDLVSENVPEIVEVKAATYKALSAHALPETIFTSNSSTLLPSQFAESTGRPARFCALHFANGIWDANIGEVMAHPGTEPEVFERVVQFAKQIGMVPLRCHKEQSGYIINTLLVPWLNAAQTLVTKGVCATEDVDRAWVICFGIVNSDKGPLGIMDMIGHGTAHNVLKYWGANLPDAQMAANADYIKKELLDKGKLGLCGGDPDKDKATGFYNYPNPAWKNHDFLNGTE
ncbi:Hadh [Symbiodinium sp. CCMP2456]|nr:Hadh [Symbiodinium sp. CCMP2456]